MDPWTVVELVVAVICVVAVVVYSFLKPYFQQSQTTVGIQDDHPDWIGAQRDREFEPNFPEGDPADDFLDAQPDIIEDNKTL